MPERDLLRERLRLGLTQLGPTLRLVAESLCGEEDELIDWLAMEADGRAVVALLAPGPASAALLADGLAQRAWVAARLDDWRKLAPSLELSPRLRPRLLLVAADFPRRVRVAAREADASGIWLARHREADGGTSVLERLDRGRACEPDAPSASPRSARSFRSGLSDEDLGALGELHPRSA